MTAATGTPRVTLAAAAAAAQRGTVLRCGDIIQAFWPGDFELLRGRGAHAEWLCTTFPIGFRLGGGGIALDDEPTFDHHVPADMAERAALEGRIVYPADPWSTWTEGR